MLGGAGDLLGALDAEGFEIFEEGLFKARRVLSDREARRGRVADNLVVDIGDVHDVANGDAEEL